jgi:16S rRNA (adenine1518-N6/adenine1519-N6)-dimethyltransferase
VYGVPSVKAAWYCEVKRAGSIGRNVFWPAPNVDSGLVSLIRREQPRTSATREEVFAVVDAAFAQRRKTLRAALAGWAGSAAAAETALRAAGVAPSARGEALTVEEFAAIAEHKDAHRHTGHTGHIEGAVGQHAGEPHAEGQHAEQGGAEQRGRTA